MRRPGARAPRLGAAESLRGKAFRGRCLAGLPPWRRATAGALPQLPCQLLRGGGVVVPVPGVVLLAGGTAGGVVVPSGLVVLPGAVPDGVAGAVLSGVMPPPVPEVPEVPLEPGVVAGVASGVAAGVAGAVLVSLCLLQPPSSAHTMALPRTSLLVFRNGAVMMDPFSLESCRESSDESPGIAGLPARMA